MNLEEATTLLKGEFGKRLFDYMLNYAIPLEWGIKEKDDWRILSNGTAFILDCGQGPFLVTAAHVYEGYLDAREKHSTLRCQIGNLNFCPEERLICALGSEVLDVATFKIERDEIKYLEKWPCHIFTEWPPRNAVKNDGVILCGFPGVERTQTGKDSITHGCYATLALVESSSERHFGISIVREDLIDPFGRGIPEEGYDLGGASGGPMILLRELDSGVVIWHIVGIVYNAAKELGQIVLAHHVSSINADGSLRAPA